MNDISAAPKSVPDPTPVTRAETMTDSNHGAADLLLSAWLRYVDDSNNGSTEAHGGAGGPTPLDLEDTVGRLRTIGVRCRLGEDGLWAGKLCLHACGTVSVDGRVRGLKPARLGRGVEGFVEALRRIGAIPDHPEQPVSGQQSKKRDRPWCRLPRVAAQRLKGRRAEQAIARMHAFLAMHVLGYEQLGPGRFLICGRVYFNPPSGRVRLKTAGHIRRKAWSRWRRCWLRRRAPPSWAISIRHSGGGSTLAC